MSAGGSLLQALALVLPQFFSCPFFRSSPTIESLEQANWQELCGTGW